MGWCGFFDPNSVFGKFLFLILIAVNIPHENKYFDLNLVFRLVNKNFAVITVGSRCRYRYHLPDTTLVELGLGRMYKH